MQKTANQPWLIAAVPIILAGFGWFIKLEVGRASNREAIDRHEAHIVALEAAINGSNGQQGVLTQLAVIIEAQKESNRKLDDLKRARNVP